MVDGGASEKWTGISLVSCGVGWVFPESRSGEDHQGNEEVTDVGAFSVGPSPHEECLAENVFVDDVRGGVLKTESRASETRGSPVVPWHGRLGARFFETTWRQKEAKAGSLPWMDTDNSDAGPPNYRPRLVVREIKRAMKKSDVLSAAEFFNGM